MSIYAVTLLLPLKRRFKNELVLFLFGQSMAFLIMTTLLVSRHANSFITCNNDISFTWKYQYSMGIYV